MGRNLRKALIYLTNTSTFANYCNTYIHNTMFEKITLENFLSFKERTEFSFIASLERPKKGFEFAPWYEVVDNQKLLKAQFLFGNNGTGKSNFLSAISVLSNMACTKSLSKTSENSKLPETYFKLSEESIEKPSSITSTFHTNGRCYTYSISWLNNIITTESLTYRQGKKKELTVFSRSFDSDQDIVTIDFETKFITPEDQNIIRNNIIQNGSVISIYDEKNLVSEDIRNVYEYFYKIGIYFNLDSIDLSSMFENRKDKDSLRKILLNLLHDLGSNIVDYNVETIESKMNEQETMFLKILMGEEELKKRYPDGVKKMQSIKFAHSIDKTDKLAWLRESEESEGTLNMIRLIILLYDACSRKSPVIIDECVSGIHQQTFGRILQFFLSSATHTQAIMASQHLAIIEMDGFRRDTLKFFDKDRETGISHCKKVDLHKYHKNQNLIKVYLDNSFGCLPEFPTMETWKENLCKYKEFINDESN